MLCPPAAALIAALAACSCLSAASTSPSRPIDFDREIRPILSDRCFACHGPDEKKRMANLRLDLKDGGAYTRDIVTPGASGKSLIYQRITAAKMRMPPPSAGPALNEKQADLIRRWIDEGAKWEAHWAFVAPKRPEVPEVKLSKSVRNPIDSFVLARLEKEGLTPSPEADKATLLRRVTFDLTGLPPTPAEVDGFLADKSANAYEKRVDALLGSPRYGERMAMQWLDFARYADTHGYHIDSHREQWHWRDWVIDAFNRNMPYNEFIVEQLAGDLLPGSTLAQKIATGFNRNHMINFEGGAIPEEYQNEYVVDRVETTSVAFMGLTMGCARCHDHKYDPISQKDFYRFYAFFNTIPEKGLDGMTGNAEPVVRIPSTEQAHDLEQVERDLKTAEAAFPQAEVDRLQAVWEQSHFHNLPEPSRDGLLSHYEFDGSLADSSGRYQRGRVTAGDISYRDGMVDKAADFDGETSADFGNVGDYDGSKPFSIAVWVRSGSILPMPVLQKEDATAARSGYELYFDAAVPIGDLRRGGPIGFRLIHQWPDQVLDVQTAEKLPATSKEDNIGDAWYHVVANYDGSGQASGLKLWINGKAAELKVVKDHLGGTSGSSGPFQIRGYKGEIDDLRLYDRRLTAEEIHQLAVDQPQRATILIPGTKRSKQQAARLHKYFLTVDAPEQYRSTFAEINRLEAAKQKLENQIPTAMVMEEADKPRDTFVLGRGDYTNHLEKVTPGVPPVLPPLPSGAPLNRLTLAKWLVEPGHPLTSRVAVNHFWNMYFGIGLVKTAENFGSQGEPPTNPQLLDWLATEFVRTGWDVKAMQRLIVTSAAYRQSSKVSPQLQERDPENQLIARGPRFRLPAEMVRDNALAISGLLVEKTGGPGAHPYQPKGLWEEIAYGDVFSAQSYVPDHGEDLYRRSMYDFWKRTSPPPSLITFDAPDREKCTARRTVTNTPLQALVLLNDPTYIEAARALAQRMLTEGGRDAQKRIAFAFRLAVARPPAAEEVAALIGLEKAESAQYHAHPEEAGKLLRVGESKIDPKLDQSELAAWTTVASAILNLDETITKE